MAFFHPQTWFTAVDGILGAFGYTEGPSYDLLEGTLSDDTILNAYDPRVPATSLSTAIKIHADYTFCYDDETIDALAEDVQSTLDSIARVEDVADSNIADASSLSPVAQTVHDLTSPTPPPNTMPYPTPPLTPSSAPSPTSPTSSTPPPPHSLLLTPNPVYIDTQQQAPLTPSSPLQGDSFRTQPTLVAQILAKLGSVMPRPATPPLPWDGSDTSVLNLQGTPTSTTRQVEEEDPRALASVGHTDGIQTRSASEALGRNTRLSKNGDREDGASAVDVILEANPGSSEGPRALSTERRTGSWNDEPSWKEEVTIKLGELEEYQMDVDEEATPAPTLIAPPGKLLCPRSPCTATFYREKDLERHLLTAKVHNAEKVFMCSTPHCESKYARRDACKRHEHSCTPAKVAAKAAKEEQKRRRAEERQGRDDEDADYEPKSANNKKRSRK